MNPKIVIAIFEPSPELDTANELDRFGYPDAPVGGPPVVVVIQNPFCHLR